MLNHTLLPMALFHKSKELAWDPRDLDMAQDSVDWHTRMNPRERQLIQSLSVMFLGGERAVAHDLAPMLVGVRRMGGLAEEEMFLTTQLYEESKHVEFFERVMIATDMAAGVVDLGEAYHVLFEQRLPAALNRLAYGDDAPEAHVTALCTYHMAIEGILAETGYRGYVQALKSNRLMPGTVSGVAFVQRDEARHIAYGLHALGRWFKTEPALRTHADDTLNELLGLILQIVADAFEPFGDDVPFALDLSEFVAYAGEQFNNRMLVLERGLTRFTK